jgi:hypothetical protein
MTKWILGVALALLVGAPAFADTILVPTTSQNGCRTWRVCDAQVQGTTTCQSAGSNAILRAGREYTWTAFSQASGDTGNWTAKIYSAGLSGGFISGTGDRALLNSSDVTPTNPMFSWNGIMGDIHVVLGGTIHLSNGITIDIRGCELTRP